MSNSFKDSLKCDINRSKRALTVKNIFVRRLRNVLYGQARFIKEEIYLAEEERREGLIIVNQLLARLEELEKENQGETEKTSNERGE